MEAGLVGAARFAGFRQRYDRIGPLLEGDGMRIGKVLEATVHLLECSRLWDMGASALRRDPLFFVEKTAI